MKRIFLKTMVLSLLVLTAGCFVGCEEDSDNKAICLSGSQGDKLLSGQRIYHSEVTILERKFVNM